MKPAQETTPKRHLLSQWPLTPKRNLVTEPFETSEPLQAGRDPLQRHQKRYFEARPYQKRGESKGPSGNKTHTLTSENLHPITPKNRTLCFLTRPFRRENKGRPFRPQEVQVQGASRDPDLGVSISGHSKCVLLVEPP